MSELGWLGIIGLTFAAVLIVGSLYGYKDGWLSKITLCISIIGGLLVAGMTLTVAPMTLWDRYEVSGVVQEVHPVGILELSGGRVVEVQDRRIVTLRKGDVVNMTCETVRVNSRSEACQVNW